MNFENFREKIDGLLDRGCINPYKFYIRVYTPFFTLSHLEMGRRNGIAGTRIRGRPNDHRDIFSHLARQIIRRRLRSSVLELRVDYSLRIQRDFPPPGPPNTSVLSRRGYFLFPRPSRNLMIISFFLSNFIPAASGSFSA